MNYIHATTFYLFVVDYFGLLVSTDVEVRLLN